MIWQASYTPFGLATVEVETVENNIRFPGQYFDVESSLHCNYFRDYDPQTGRYIESDPIGLNGGINTHGYAGQNPVMHIDPNGLWWWNTARIGFQVGRLAAQAQAAYQTAQLQDQIRQRNDICRTTGFGCGTPLDILSDPNQNSSSDWPFNYPQPVPWTRENTTETIEQCFNNNKEPDDNCEVIIEGENRFSPLAWIVYIACMFDRGSMG